MPEERPGFAVRFVKKHACLVFADETFFADNVTHVEFDVESGKFIVWTDDYAKSTVVDPLPADGDVLDEAAKNFEHMAYQIGGSGVTSFVDAAKYFNCEESNLNLSMPMGLTGPNGIAASPRSPELLRIE